MNPVSNNHKKGFASMTPELRRAIASKGGKASRRGKPKVEAVKVDGLENV